MGLALLPHVGLAQSHQNSRSRWFVSEALELTGGWKERGDCSAIQIQTAGQWQQTTSLPSKAALKGTMTQRTDFTAKIYVSAKFLSRTAWKESKTQEHLRTRHLPSFHANSLRMSTKSQTKAHLLRFHMIMLGFIKNKAVKVPPPS